VIDTPSAPAAQAGIDRAIAGALSRIDERLSGMHDTGADALSAAVRRAAAGGKRFRPGLVVGAYEALGGTGDRDDVYAVAAAFELLHTAFVVHDDVIDHDTERRGVLNVGGEFRARARARGADAAGAASLGDAAAILGGDLLLHEATRTIALTRLSNEVRADLLDLFDDAVIVSIVGELADVENALVPGDALDADAILLATHNKTAVYSFCAPLEAGAVLAGAPTSSRTTLRRFGQRLGLAYQLVDDLIGAFGTARQAGRDEGGDLREAKWTPLIALARESSAWPEVSDALAEAHTGPVAVRAAQRALSASGARTRLEALVTDTLDEAADEVSSSLLPDSARSLLRGLVDAVRERIP
jgi:geranylgeranyl pyrophosphate synthase